MQQKLNKLYKKESYFKKRLFHNPRTGFIYHKMKVKQKSSVSIVSKFQSYSPIQ